MNEFTAQFLLEARELTEQASTDLLALEQSPNDAGHLDGAFRAFHTLKGGAGIMDYAAMERLLHGAEDLLQDIRSGKQVVTPSVIDGCLACIGQVIRWLDVIEKTGEMPADAEAAATRVALQLADTPAAAKTASASWAQDLVVWSRDKFPASNTSPQLAVRYQPRGQAFFEGEDPVALFMALPGLRALRLAPREPWPALADVDPFSCNLTIEALFGQPRADVVRALGPISGAVEFVELSATPSQPSGLAVEAARTIILAQREFILFPRPAEALSGAIGAAGKVIANVLRSLGREIDVAPVEVATAGAIRDATAEPLVAAIDRLLESSSPEAASAARDEPADGRRDGVAGTIRVDVAKVDSIVDLTGELLVVKNALAHWVKLAAEGVDAAALVAGLRTQHARLDRHVIELQRAVLDLRVLPLARVFGRFPLLVRETASRLGKQVTFLSEGDDTEADKAIVEALFEPLLHVVRNAIDHGIETPEARLQAGKTASATIVMRGQREGDRVIVEVSDDGKGVDPAIVRRLAVARSLASADTVAALSDDEAVDLIFAPGFSTATSVTDLSGRGVGMNAVRTSVERMGGEVSLQNTPGQGLTVRVTLPFTVMMTRVMTVEIGGQMFGLPFDSVLETLKTPRSQIRPLGGGRAFILRDLTIPVIDLASSLALDLASPQKPDTVCIVVAMVAGQRVGLEIDRPGERLDMMLKPVEGVLAGMPAISGASLLGDGRVLIVLDLGALL